MQYLCSSIPMASWGRSRFATEFVISTNSAEAIYNASTVWKGTAAAAITFLGLVSLVGWWSQKRLRYQVKLMISHVDDTAETRPTRTPNGEPAQLKQAPRSGDSILVPSNESPSTSKELTVVNLDV